MTDLTDTSRDLRPIIATVLRIQAEQANRAADAFADSDDKYVAVSKLKCYLELIEKFDDLVTTTAAMIVAIECYDDPDANPEGMYETLNTMVTEEVERYNEPLLDCTRNVMHALTPDVLAHLDAEVAQDSSDEVKRLYDTIRGEV